MANVKVMNALEVLNAALAVGWVKFQYYKADGSIRVAIGTRNISLIEQITHKFLDTDKSRKYFTNCNGYFDLVRCDWRQFNNGRFIGIDFSKMSYENAVIGATAIILGEDFESAMEKDSALETLALAADCLLGNHVGRAVVIDAHKQWCIRYNGGRGLNGVLISAGENGGSGCLGWVGAPSTPSAPSVGVVFHETKRADSRRALLIKELHELRKRESEILAELLD